MIEEWKDIKDWEGLYQISNLGRVKSLDRKASDGRKVIGRILKPRPDHNGYYRVQLFCRPKISERYIHQLVLENFVGPCPENMEGCHNDGVCTNNELINLRWDTKSNNHKDCVKHGTYFLKTLRGSESPNSKISLEDVQEIKYLRNEQKLTLSSIGRRFGLGTSQVWRIALGKSWSHI